MPLIQSSSTVARLPGSDPAESAASRRDRASRQQTGGLSAWLAGWLLGWLAASVATRHLPLMVSSNGLTEENRMEQKGKYPWNEDKYANAARGGLVGAVSMEACRRRQRLFTQQKLKADETQAVQARPCCVTNNLGR